MTLKQQLLEAGLGLTEDDFGEHNSNLYVRDTPATKGWLAQNYEFHAQIVPFIGSDKKPWLDIPFARMDEYIEERRAERTTRKAKR